MRRAWGLLVILTLAAPLPAQMGDSTRGAELLRQNRCTLCHAIGGIGGGTAPDLAVPTTRGFSAATMAAMMWNHGPAMWRAMRQQNVEPPALTEAQMGDIYAYFYALRYFDPPGDAARGKDVFVSKQCYRCHALTADAGGIGPPVPLWPTLADPVLWVQQMWNHSGEMARQMERQGIRWPKFSVREMVDMMVYLEHLPAVRSLNPTLRLGDPSAGAQIFDQKNCSQCHTLGEDVAGKADLLETAEHERRLSGLAVEMWNHRPLMETAARNRGIELHPFEGHQMADLLAYFFQRGYFLVQGDPRRGKRLFSQKKCSACHGQADSGAPDLRAAQGTFTPTRFASVVWQHGPTMLDRMQQRGVTWPVLNDRDVADLIAFLNRR